MASIYAYFIINKNNLLFKRYIYWYVIYLVYGLASLIIYAFIHLDWMVPNTNTQLFPTKLLFIKSLILVPLVLIKLTYDIYSLNVKNKNFLFRYSQIIAAMAYTVLKIIGLLATYALFYFFITNRKEIYEIFDKKNTLITAIANLNQWIFTGIVFALIVYFVLLVYLAFIINKNNFLQKNLVKSRLNKLANIFTTLITSTLIFALYFLSWKFKNELFVENDKLQKILFLTMPIVVNFSLLTAYFIFTFIKKHYFAIHNNKAKYLNLGLLLLIQINTLIFNLFVENNYKIILLVFSTLFYLIAFIRLKKLDIYFNRIESLVTLINVMFMAAFVVFQIAIFTTIHFNNYAIYSLTETIDLANVMLIVSLSGIGVLYIFNLLKIITSLGLIYFYGLREKRMKRIIKNENN
nr:hypothetical protein [Mycoplasmopsis iners]